MYCKIFTLKLKIGTAKCWFSKTGNCKILHSKNRNFKFSFTKKNMDQMLLNFGKIAFSVSQKDAETSYFKLPKL
jgi:hypothetical protein